MAKKESPDDLIDKNDDWDFDDDDFGGMDSFGGEDEEDGGERKPKNSFKSSVNKTLTHVGKETSKGVALGIATSIGKGIPQVKDNYDSATEAISELNRLKYDVLDKSRPIINESKKVAKQLLRQTKGIVPFGLDQKLLNFLEKHSENEEDKREVDIAEERENKLTQMLGDVFTMQTEKSMEMQQRQATDRIIDEQLTKSRHNESMGVMSSMKKALFYQTAFTKSVFTSYLKKDLELKLRHLYVAQDQLNVMNVTSKMLEQRLDAIVKNTGLPDAQKITSFETARRMMKERFLSSSGNRIRNLFSGITTKIQEEWVDPFLDSISMGNQAIEGIAGLLESMNDADGMGMGSGDVKWNSKTGLAGKLGGFLGGIGGGKIVRKLLSKLDPKTQQQIKMLFGNGKQGQYLAIRKLIESGKLGYVGELIGDLMPDMSTNTTIDNITYDNPTAGATLRNKTIETIEKIIPGYLSMQTRFLEIIATGNKDAKELKWDFKNQKFSTSGEITKDFITEAFGDREQRLSWMRAGADRTKKMIDVLGNTKHKEKLSTSYALIASDVETFKMSLARAKDIIMITEDDLEFFKSAATGVADSDNDLWKYGLSKCKNPKAVASFLYALFTTRNGAPNNGTIGQFTNDILSTKLMFDDRIQRVFAKHGIDLDNSELMNEFGKRNSDGSIDIDTSKQSKYITDGIDNNDIASYVSSKKVDEYGNFEENVEKTQFEKFMDKGADWIKNSDLISKGKNVITSGSHDVLKFIFTNATKLFGSSDKEANKRFEKFWGGVTKGANKVTNAFKDAYDSAMDVVRSGKDAAANMLYDFCKNTDNLEPFCKLLFKSKRSKNKTVHVFKDDISAMDLAEFFGDSENEKAMRAIKWLRENEGNPFVTALITQCTKLQEVLELTRDIEYVDENGNVTASSAISEILKIRGKTGRAEKIKEILEKYKARDNLNIDETEQMLNNVTKSTKGNGTSLKDFVKNTESSVKSTDTVTKKTSDKSVSDKILDVLTASGESLKYIQSYVLDMASMMRYGKFSPSDLKELREQYTATNQLHVEANRLKEESRLASLSERLKEQARNKNAEKTANKIYKAIDSSKGNIDNFVNIGEERPSSIVAALRKESEPLERELRKYDEDHFEQTKNMLVKNGMTEDEAVRYINDKRNEAQQKLEEIHKKYGLAKKNKEEEPSSIIDKANSALNRKIEELNSAHDSDTKKLEDKYKIYFSTGKDYDKHIDTLSKMWGTSKDRVRNFFSKKEAAYNEELRTLEEQYNADIKNLNSRKIKSKAKATESVLRAAGNFDNSLYERDARGNLKLDKEGNAVLSAEGKWRQDFNTKEKEASKSVDTAYTKAIAIIGNIKAFLTKDTKSTINKKIIELYDAFKKFEPKYTNNAENVAWRNMGIELIKLVNKSLPKITSISDKVKSKVSDIIGEYNEAVSRYEAVNKERDDHNKENERLAKENEKRISKLQKQFEKQINELEKQQGKFSSGKKFKDSDQESAFVNAMEDITNIANAKSTKKIKSSIFDSEMLSNMTDDNKTRIKKLAEDYKDTLNKKEEAEQLKKHNEARDRIYADNGIVIKNGKVSKKTSVDKLTSVRDNLPADLPNRSEIVKLIDIDIASLKETEVKNNKKWLEADGDTFINDGTKLEKFGGVTDGITSILNGKGIAGEAGKETILPHKANERFKKLIFNAVAMTFGREKAIAVLESLEPNELTLRDMGLLNNKVKKYAEGGVVNDSKSGNTNKEVTLKSSNKEILLAQLDVLRKIYDKTIYGINFEQFKAMFENGKDFMSEWFHKFNGYASDKLSKVKTGIGGKLEKVKSFGSTIKNIAKSPFSLAGSLLLNKRIEVYRLPAEGEPLGDPLITDKDWKAGLYTDPDCEKPLKSVDDISGPVWGSDGHKRIDDTDIKAGLCDENRKPISSKIRKLGRLMRKAVMGSAKLATLPFRLSSTMIWNTIYNKTCDVYKNPNDKNVCLGDALVTKQDFVDGLYADPEKKKRITSVADIKGDVYNNKGERVIKKEDLPFLCDEKRRPINSFASRLGRTFRGVGGFVFDKISNLKPLEKLGKLANLPFKILHKLNSVNCDVYSNRDPNTVLVTAEDFKRGRVMDEDGKLIRAASDINGKVWWTNDPVNGEKAGQIAINDEDLEKGLIDNKGNEIKSRFRFIADIGLNGVTTAASAIVGVGKGMLKVAKHVGKVLFVGKDKFIDVYADDENGERVLKLEGNKIKDGKYLIKHKETFTQLESAYGIDGEVYIMYRRKPKLVLSLDDIRNGLYDAEGNKLTKYRGMSLVGAAGSMLMGGAKKVIGGIGKGIVGLGKMVSGAWNAGKDFFSSMFSGITSSITGSGLFLNRRDLEEVVGDRLLDIYHLLYVRLPDKKKVNGDVDGDGDRDGSYEDWMQKREERKRRRAEKNAAKKGKAKGSNSAGFIGNSDDDDVDNDGSFTDTLMNLWMLHDIFGGKGGAAKPKPRGVLGRSLDKLKGGFRSAGGRVLNGAKLIGGKVLRGAKSTGGKVLSGVKSTGSRVLSGVGKTAGKLAGKTIGKTIAKTVGMRALAAGLGAAAGANIWNPVGWAMLAATLGVVAYDVLKTDPMDLKWQHARFKFYGADKEGVTYDFAYEDYLKDLEKATFKAMINGGALDMSELEHFGRNVGMLYGDGIGIREKIGGFNTDSMREDKQNRLEYLKEWYVKRFFPAFDMYTRIVKAHEEGGEEDSFPDVRLIPFGFQDQLVETYEKMCSKLPQEYKDFDLYSINDNTGYEKWLERKNAAEKERRASLSPQELKLEDAKKALANDDKWRYDSTADNFSQAWYNLKNWNWIDATADLTAGIGSLVTDTIGSVFREVGGWFTTSANYDAWAVMKKDLYGLDSGCDIENVRELEELATRVWLGKRRDISRAEVKDMIDAVDGPENYDDFVKTACAECGVDESDGEEIANSYILTWFRRRFIPINKVYTAVICALTGEKPGDMLDVDDIPDQYREDALDQMTNKCNELLKQNDIEDLKLDTAAFADYLFKRGINDLEDINKLKSGLSLGERAAESFSEGTDHVKKAWDKLWSGDVPGGIWEGIKAIGSYTAGVFKGIGAIGDKIGFWLCDMFGDTANEVYWKMRFESYKLSENVTNAIIAGNGDVYTDAIEKLEELAQEIIDGEESLNDEDIQEDILNCVSILYSRLPFIFFVNDKLSLKFATIFQNPNNNKEKSPRAKFKRFFLLWFKMSFLPAFLVLLNIHRQYTKQGKGTEVDVDDFPEDSEELFEEFKKGAKQATDQTGGPVLDEQSFIDTMSERAKKDNNSVLNRAEAIEAKEEENTLKSAISKNIKASSVVDKNTQTKMLAKLNLNRAEIKNDINLIGSNVKELMKWFSEAYGVWDGNGTKTNSPENLRKIKHKYYGIDITVTKDFNKYIDELEKHAFDELFKGESPDEDKLKKILENIAVETGLYKSESGLFSDSITEPETSKNKKLIHLKKWYCLRFVPVYSTYCEIVTAIRESTTPEYVTDDFITSLPVLKVMTLFKLMDKYLPNSIIDEGKAYDPTQSSYNKLNGRVGESKGRQQAAEKYNHSGVDKRTVDADNSNTAKGSSPTKLARGGIVNQETRFDFGIAGEAGPESIVPLRNDGRFDSLIAQSVDIAKGRDAGDMVRNALRGDSENISGLPSKDLFKSITRFTSSSSGDLTSLSRMLNVDGLSARDLLAGLFSLQLVNLSMASRGTVDGKNKPHSAEDEENGVSDILSGMADSASGILDNISSGFKGTFNTIADLGSSVIRTGGSVGNYIANKASSAWNNASDFISGLFGGDNVKPVTSISNTPADVKARMSKAWKVLKSSGLTDEAVAGILGNVRKEAGSEFTPVIRQGDTRDRTHKKSFEYTAKYDNDKQAFTCDRDVGYGLCQWTYHTRKAALWEFAHGKKKSIGDFDTQVEFIIHELDTTHKGVKDKLKGCKDLLKATALVLRGYEQPARQDDVELRERYGYAREMYSMFSGNSDEQLDSIIKESSQISSTESPSNNIASPVATGDGAELAKYANIKPGVNTGNFNPVLANNFAGMAKEFKETTGSAVTITSGARTMAQQQALYDKYGSKRAAKPNPLAPHISGLALDANSADMDKADELGLLDKYNLWRPLKNWSKTKEPWHVEVKGSRDPNTGTITQASLDKINSLTNVGTSVANSVLQSMPNVVAASMDEQQEKSESVVKDMSIVSAAAGKELESRRNEFTTSTNTSGGASNEFSTNVSNDTHRDTPSAIDQEKLSELQMMTNLLGDIKELLKPNEEAKPIDKPVVSTTKTIENKESEVDKLLPVLIELVKSLSPGASSGTKSVASNAGQSTRTRSVNFPLNIAKA